MADASLLFKMLMDASQAKREATAAREHISKEMKQLESAFGKDAGYSSKLANATGVFISDSQRAIANAQNVATGAERAIQRTTTNIAAAQKQAASFTSQLSSMAGQAGAVIGVLSGVASGAIAAGTAIFKLAQNAAESAGHFFDLSQKTGLATETISALSLASDKGEASIDEISQAVVIFSRTIGEAARGSDAAKEKLERLGVDPQKAVKDLDGALAQAFKTIANGRSDVEQTSLATDAFGRSGANLKGIILDANGSLEKIIETARELGLVIDNETGRRADEFGTTLVTLQTQLKALANTIGHEVIPVITKGMGDASASLKENRESWKEWGRDVGAVTALAIEAIRSDLQKLEFMINASPAGFLLLQAGRRIADNARTNTTGTKLGTSDVSGSRQGQADLGNWRDIVDPADVKRAKEREEREAETAARKAEAAARKAEAAARKAEDEARERARARFRDIEGQLDEEQLAYQKQADNLERIYDQKLVDLDGYVQQFEAIENRHLNALKALFERERQEADQTEKTEEARLAKRREIDNKEKAAEYATQKAIADVRERARQKEADALAQHLREVADLHDRAREREIEIINRAIEIDVGNVEEGTKKIDAILEASFIERRNLLLKDLALAGADKQERQRIYNELAKLNDDYSQRFLDNARKRTEALINERIEQLRQTKAISAPPGLDLSASGPRNQYPAELGAAIIKDIGEAPPPDFSPWFEAFNMLKESGANAFNSLARGMGNLVQQYILLGTTGPAALKKLLASAVASIAAEAAVRAIFELAKGFAALFLNPAEAAAHFKAAALFGSIAGAATVVGRAIAGDSFQNDARNDRGLPTGSRLAQEDRPTQPIDVGRRTGEASTINIVVTSRPQPGTIIETLVEDYRNNGRSRSIIRDDGVLAT